MPVKMLVTLRRDDFSAAIGEVVDVDAAFAHGLIQNAQAEPTEVIHLPRVDGTPRKKYAGAVVDQSDVDEEVD